MIKQRLVLFISHQDRCIVVAGEFFLYSQQASGSTWHAQHTSVGVKCASFPINVVGQIIVAICIFDRDSAQSADMF